MTSEALRSFLGWCAIFNLIFVSLWFFIICFARGLVYRLHRRRFVISDQTLSTSFTTPAWPGTRRQPGFFASSLIWCCVFLSEEGA